MAERISYEVDFSAKGAQTLWNEFLAGSQSAGKALNESLGGRVKKELFIEVKADDSGVKRLVAGEREVLTELQKIINLQEKANKTQQGSVTSLRQQVNEAKQARDGMVKYASAADGVFAKVGKINGAWDAQNQRVKTLQKELDVAGASNIWERLSAEYNLGGLASAGRQISELVNVFQSVSIVVGQVIGSVNKLFDALQKLQSIKLTFEGIGKGGEVEKVFSETNRIAIGLGVNLNTVREGFQQLSPVILATGGNMNDVSAITESLSSRFVTFGLSADKSRRIMNGVIQAFGKGKLMAEELTQQISEADPAFRTDLATAIGVTVKELGEMVKAGQVTNAVLLEAIPRMTKASGLFGKLGNSALDAAQGFREGGVTVEQFRNQIATIEQLSLENLVNPETGSLQPLLASLLELRAVVTDVGVAFANSEIFKTFIVVLGSIASQVSFVIQALVKFGSVVAAITQPIFGVLNAIDSLGGTLKGFGLISSVVAGIIVTKLVAALVTLGSGAIVGAATAAITGLTKAIVFFSSGAALALADTVGVIIVQLLGLTTATAGSTAAQEADKAATMARAGAKAFLLKQLGLQAAADTLSASAAGTAAAAQVKTAGGIVITGAAAAAATPPVTALATATTGLAAATAAAAIPLLAIAAAVAVVVAGFSIYKAINEDATEVTKKFSASLKTIEASAEAAKKSLDNGAKGASAFAIKLAALEKASLFEVGGRSGFGQQVAEANLDRVIDSTRKVGETIKASFATAKKSVEEYNAATDKSGIGAKKIAQDVVAAQAAITSALEITRAKRDQLLAEEIKAGKPTAAIIEKLRALDAEIEKTEELERAQAALRVEARKKGIVVNVELDVKDAGALTGELQEKLKGLKASIVLETNPEKRAKLQGDLNGLQAQLEFLESDIVQVTIDATFKINQRALQDAASLSDAISNNLSAATGYAQSLFGLQTAYLSGAEKTRQIELDSINERLDKEKEIRDERMQDAKDRGANEAAIKALEKEGRDADKIGREEIKAKELEIEAIAERKRQMEIKALQAKRDALPAQQAAERASLQIQQDMVALELERLKLVAERAKLEGQQRRITLGGQISTARKEKDPELQTLIDLYNNQLKLNGLLDKEVVSLGLSGEKMKEINGYQLSALGYKQAAETLDADAALAAVNGLSTQKAITTAIQDQATAGTNKNQNAAAFEQFARAAAEYEKSGAAAARRDADAKADAAKAAKDNATKARDAATANQDAATATGDAVKPTDDTTTNLEEGAVAAKAIVDQLAGLDGKEINVNVNYVGGTQGLWTGGPTVGGQTYRINELGKEGFLSSTGTLSPINKPRNALWKAPGKGMVIPAHIMSTLDVPTGRVSTGVRPSVAGSGGNGLTKIARAIQAALSQTNKPDSGLQEMAAVQAHQAVQIGKLSRAVTKLADKDWNVNVGVRNTGSTAYLDALNRRM